MLRETVSWLTMVAGHLFLLRALRLEAVHFVEGLRGFQSFGNRSRESALATREVSCLQLR